MKDIRTRLDKGEKTTYKERLWFYIATKKKAKGQKIYLPYGE